VFALPAGSFWARAAPEINVAAAIAASNVFIAALLVVAGNKEQRRTRNEVPLVVAANSRLILRMQIPMSGVSRVMIPQRCGVFHAP
jgi:hypothetical protein